MSKITVAQLQVGIAQYIEKDIVPNIPTTTHYPFGKLLPIELNSTAMQFFGGVGVAYGAKKIEQFLPILATVGIVDEEGTVDIDGLSTVLNEQLAKVGGKLPIGPLTFGAEDLQKLFSYMVPATIVI